MMYECTVYLDVFHFICFVFDLHMLLVILCFLVIDAIKNILNLNLIDNFIAY